MKYRPLHHKKNNKAKNILGVIVLIFVVYLGINFGLPLFADSILYISSVTRPKEKAKTNPNLIETPILYSMPIATNAANIYVTGTGQKDKELRIFRNEQEVENILLDSSDFEIMIPLKDGSNTIYAQLIDPKTLESKNSKTYTVMFNKKELILDITSPSEENTKTDSEDIVIEGVTEPDVDITINNKYVVLHSDYSFSKQFTLVMGENKFNIKAVDLAGNSIEKIITVVREEI